MKEILKLEIFTISIWHLVAIIALTIAIVVLSMKANRTSSLKSFVFVLVTIMLWLLGKIFKTVAPTESIRWGFIVFYYAAICLLEVALLEFSYVYYKGSPINLKMRILLYIVPLIQFVIIITNPYHHLFYSYFDFFKDKFGPLFYLHLFIEYIYIVIAIILCRKKLKSQIKYKSRVYKNILAFAILGPIILNLLYVSRILQDIFKFVNLPIIFDLTPIVFTWSALIFVYTTFKYEFFDLSPMMKHEIVHKLDTPICIIDTNLDVLFVNERLIKQFKLGEYPQILSEMIRENRKKLLLADSNQNFDNIFKNGNDYYLYYSKKINSFEGTKFIIVFNKVTKYIEAKEELSRNNEQLEFINLQLNNQIDLLKNTSKAGARNFVARELHDIIGHSMVVTMKLLEVVKIDSDGDINMVEQLNKAKLLMSKGINEIKEINSSKSMIYNGQLLKNELEINIQQVKASGIAVNFYFNGKTHAIDEKAYEVISMIVKELITNMLKHANAKRLVLSCNISEKQLSLFFMDDGIGISDLIKGNGLKGIESRLLSVAGKVEFSTQLKEGFSANISIPLKKLMNKVQ